MNAKKVSTTKVEKSAADSGIFLFRKENYILMLLGIVIISIGFVLMSGSEDIFNNTKLTVVPIFVVIGFIVEIFDIMYRPNNIAE